MNHTTVQPVRVRRDSDDLGCTVVRVVGHRAECGCGWCGKTWDTPREAKLEASFHECQPLAA